MEQDIRHIVINFHHACPDASDIVKNAYNEALRLAHAFTPRHNGAQSVTLDPFTKLSRDWKELSLVTFKKRKKEHNPIRLVDSYLDTITFLKNQGYPISLIYRYPVDIAQMIVENAFNEEKAQPLWEILEANKFYSTHGVKDRKTVFESVVNGFTPKSFLSIVGSAYNAEASTRTEMKIWGYLGEDTDKKTLRAHFESLKITKIHDDWGDVIRDLQAMPRPQKTMQIFSFH